MLGQFLRKDNFENMSHPMVDQTELIEILSTFSILRKYKPNESMKVANKCKINLCNCNSSKQHWF